MEPIPGPEQIEATDGGGWVGAVRLTPAAEFSQKCQVLSGSGRCTEVSTPRIAENPQVFSGPRPAPAPVETRIAEKTQVLSGRTNRAGNKAQTDLLKISGFVRFRPTGTGGAGGARWRRGENVMPALATEGRSPVFTGAT